MPNQRQPGTKIAGAYISAEKDKALAKIAALKGYGNKAEFIRVLFDGHEGTVSQAATIGPFDKCDLAKECRLHLAAVLFHFSAVTPMCSPLFPESL